MTKKAWAFENLGKLCYYFERERERKDRTDLQNSSSIGSIVISPLVAHDLTCMEWQVGVIKRRLQKGERKTGPNMSEIMISANLFIKFDATRQGLFTHMTCRSTNDA